MMMTEADKQRFLTKLAEAVPVEGPLETPCLVWAYGAFRDGYGAFSLMGRSIGAHKMAWLVARGEIPPRLSVLHHCDVKPCVNVDHLFLGTNQDNADDKMAKGRGGHGINPGEHHGMAQLTEDQVLQIYEMAWEGVYNLTEIADMFGVSRGCVSDIKRKKNWKHLWLRPQWTTPMVEELPSFKLRRL